MNNILPEDFNGVFQFTNFSDTEYRDRWNKVEYVFPPRSTTPMSPHLFPNSSPVELQYIRKKFAYGLAQREILNTEKVKQMDAKNQANQMVKAHNALTYAPKDLEPLVALCLKPLEIKPLKAEQVVTPEIQLSESSKIVQNKAEQPFATTTDSLIPSGHSIANI